MEQFSDPEFITLQFSRTPTYFLIYNLSSSPADSSYFSLIEFEDDPNHCHHLQRVAGIKLELLKTKSDSEMNIVGIINGFVCICEISLPRHVVYIWNPITGEFIRFQAPEITGPSNRTEVSYGFGLSSKKGEYKVVRVCQQLLNDARKDDAGAYFLLESMGRPAELLSARKDYAGAYFLLESMFSFGFGGFSHFRSVPMEIYRLLWFYRLYFTSGLESREESFSCHIRVGSSTPSRGSSIERQTCLPANSWYPSGEGFALS